MLMRCDFSAHTVRKLFSKLTGKEGQRRGMLTVLLISIALDNCETSISSNVSHKNSREHRMAGYVISFYC